MTTPTSFRLSRVNTALLAAIIVLNLYVVLAPFLPAIIFAVQSHFGHRAQQLSAQLHTPAATTTPAPIQPNHLIIPSMLLNKPVYESSDTTFADIVNVLKKGIWRWPHGSTPDKGGNTVLLGHRFTYTNPRGVFYFLNKVKTGDKIGVYWKGKTYVYHVVSVKVVPPFDTSILAPTNQAELTVYTCTPVWWPKNRLVITADLTAASPQPSRTTGVRS